MNEFVRLFSLKNDTLPRTKLKLLNQSSYQALNEFCPTIQLKNWHFTENQAQAHKSMLISSF